LEEQKGIMGGRGVTSSLGGRGGNGAGQPNDATEYYVSGDGMWINQYLRGNGDFGELTESERQYLKDLDKATNGKVSAETLYRSVDATAIFGDMSETDYENLRSALVYGKDSFGKGQYADGIRQKVDGIINKTVGKTQTEKGYMSTTTSKSIAEEFGGFTGSDKPIVMNIKPSKKTRGVDLSGYDKNTSDPQKETLLARGQSYKITKIYGKNGNINVDIEMK
jgi:hypothetical protein